MMLATKIMAIRYRIYLARRFGNLRTKNGYNFDWRMKNKIRQVFNFFVNPFATTIDERPFSRLVTLSKKLKRKIPKLEATYLISICGERAKLILKLFFFDLFPIVKITDKFRDHKTKRSIYKKLKSIFHAG